MSLEDIDRALFAAGTRDQHHTVDPTIRCEWTPSGRDGHGKLFLVCTIHGEQKVVSE